MPQTSKSNVAFVVFLYSQEIILLKSFWKVLFLWILMIVSQCGYLVTWAYKMAICLRFSSKPQLNADH